MGAEGGTAEGANLPDFQQRQLDFAAHIRNPELHPVPVGIDARRMRVYAELFFDNIQGFLSNTFPVTRSLHDRDGWHALVRDFFHRHRSASPLFLEIPEEFLLWLRDERDAADDPPWLRELCHYEWVELALDIAEYDWPAAPAEGDLLAGLPVVSPLVETLSYRWPVHEIGPDHRPETPPATPTWLVVNRDRQDRVRFMASNAVTVRLLDLLRAGEVSSGRAALETIAGELGRSDVETLVEAGRATLEDLRGRDLFSAVLAPGSA